MAAEIIFPITAGMAAIAGEATASTDSILYISESGTVSISAEATASTDSILYISESGTVAISAEAEASSDPVFYIGMSGTAAISGEASALWQRWITLEGNAQINANVIYANRSIKSTTLSLTLQPGESVVIDSAQYIVTKGGDNAIGAHSGEWIDALDTEIAYIDVIPNTSTVNAQIKITPRYL